MKVTREHLDALRGAIEPLDTEQLRERYRARDIFRGSRVQDIDRRYRWDLFWAVKGLTLLGEDPYATYNDAHIDTALRKIVSPL